MMLTGYTGVIVSYGVVTGYVGKVTSGVVG